MRGLAIRAAGTLSAVMPALLLAVVRILDRPEPTLRPAGLFVHGLTVKDTRWGRCNYPATHPVYVWVVP